MDVNVALVVKHFKQWSLRYSYKPNQNAVYILVYNINLKGVKLFLVLKFLYDMTFTDLLMFEFYF